MSTGVVLGQPGQQFRPMNVPAGISPGLGYLESLSEIRIHQQFEALEVVLGWEKNNKYRICNSQEQQFMFAKEDTDCCARQCFGNLRPFDMFLTDNVGQQVLHLTRPCRCVGSFLWCCCLQEMDILAPQTGNKIGDVRQIWTCWKPKYHVNDAHGNHLFTIDGECCYCACCTDVYFPISDSSGSPIGNIIKHWSGCRELLGGVNDFTVQFPQHIDVQQKSLLLGATFLIDFNYFERNK